MHVPRPLPQNRGSPAGGSPAWLRRSAEMEAEGGIVQTCLGGSSAPISAALARSLGGTQHGRNSWETSPHMRKWEIQSNPSLVCLWNRLRCATLHGGLPSASPVPLSSHLGGWMSLCLSHPWPHRWGCQRRVMAISMVVLWRIHFLPAVISRKDSLAGACSCQLPAVHLFTFVCSHNMGCKLPFLLRWHLSAHTICPGRALTSEAETWISVGENAFVYFNKARSAGVQPPPSALNSSAAGNESWNKTSSSP